MILNFEENRLKLLRGEIVVNKYSTPHVEEAMTVARHDCLRETLEFALSYTNDPVMIDYLRGMIAETMYKLQEGA